MALAAAAQGWFLKDLSLPVRGVMLLAALALIKPGIVTDIVGLGILLIVAGINFISLRKASATV